MDVFVNEVRRRKVKKILYDKYAPMLTIRNDHINNHFSDNSFLLTAGYIYRTFYIIVN